MWYENSKIGDNVMNQHITNNKPKKKLFIILGAIILATILLVATISIILHLKNHSDQTEAIQTKKLEEDFSATIDAILGKSDANDAYISRMTAMTDDSFQIFDDSAIGNAVSNHIQYSIDNIEANDTSATVTIHLVSPDIYGFLQKSIENGSNFSDANDISNYLTSELDKGIDTIELTTECSFEYKDGHWYWFPSKEVLNALSGNLYMYFENNGYNNNGGK